MRGFMGKPASGRQSARREWMKKFIALSALLLGASLVLPQAPQAHPAHAPKYEYKLKSVMPVAGR